MKNNRKENKEDVKLDKVYPDNFKILNAFQHLIKLIF